LSNDFRSRNEGWSHRLLIYPSTVIEGTGRWPHSSHLGWSGRGRFDWDAPGWSLNSSSTDLWVDGKLLDIAKMKIEKSL